MAKIPLWTYLKVFLLLQVIFFMFATISVLLPNKTIRKNIEKSVELYNGEVIYPQYFIRNEAHQLDNFTDYLIMNLIYNANPHKPFKYVLFPQGYYIEVTQEAPIHLKYSFENQHQPPNFIYGRYWLGSSYAYRWLFLIFNLSYVRWILFSIGSLALFGFVANVSNAIGKRQMYLLLLGAVFVNYYMFFMSMQFAPVFLIAFLGSVALLKKLKKKKRIDILFLILGAVTVYFDLLTTPVLTLGIPLLVWVAYQPATIAYFNYFKSLAGYSLLWFFGYVATWAFKWLLILVFTDYSISKEVKGKLEERAGVWHGSRLDAIDVNFNVMNLVPLAAVIAVLALLAALFFNKKGIQKALLFLTVALLPLLWAFATANHVEMHSWFTYRSLWVTVSGVFLAFGSLIRWEAIRLPKLRNK